MADIYWGLTTIAAVGCVTFYLTLTFTRRVPRLVGNVLALTVVAWIFAYIRFFWYQSRLVSILPFSNLVVLGNWFPVAACALCGLAWHRIPGRVWRKSLFVGGLCLASTYSIVWPMLGETPSCMNVWENGICIQTTAKTCTPACAATLLKSYGIEATEREMAELCLTRSGTTWLGLYRGLKLKTAGTPWDVEVLTCDGSQLLAQADGPMILSVGLPTELSNSQLIASNEWGWKKGIGHSVILLSKSPPHRIRIADPTPDVGREDWTEDEFRFLYRGTALRLVKRT